MGNETLKDAKAPLLELKSLELGATAQQTLAALQQQMQMAQNQQQAVVALILEAAGIRGEVEIRAIEGGKIHYVLRPTLRGA